MAVKTICECTQKEVIEKINNILIGDGRPEDGLLFKQAKTHQDIVIIKDTMSEIKTKNDDLLKLSSEIKTTLAEITGKALGVKESENHANRRTKTTLQAFGVAIAFIAMISTMIIGFNSVKKNTENLKREIDMLDLSPITRSGHLPPAVRDSIK